MLKKLENSEPVPQDQKKNKRDSSKKQKKSTDQRQGPGHVFLRIEVAITPTKSVQLSIKNDDTPPDLASKFCKKHKLGPEMQAALTDQLKEHIDRYNLSKIQLPFQKKQNEDLPEIQGPAADSLIIHHTDNLGKESQQNSEQQADENDLAAQQSLVEEEAPSRQEQVDVVEQSSGQQQEHQIVSNISLDQEDKHVDIFN